MRRRTIVAMTGASALAVALPLRAQAPRVARVGFLTPNRQHPRAAEVVQALGELGWDQGRNLAVELRSADDLPQRLDGLAAELVRLKVDVIVAVQTPAALAARRATSSVPIVLAGIGGDPVALGLVRSLAVPEGNVTGVTGLGTDLAAKALEIVRALRSPTRRIGVLANAVDPFTPSLLEMLQSAARSLDIEPRVTRVQAAADYAPAFAAWSAAQVDAVFVQPSLALDKAIAQASLQRLPSLSFIRQFALSGGLLTYSVQNREAVQRTASYVDRILKGANPAQLPVEQPTSFELVINLRTAKALGIAVPSSLLLRATEVIE